MTRSVIINAYFDWMCTRIGEDRKPTSYRKLLSYLHGTDFTYSISRDANRAEDGVGLRYRFAYDTGLPEIYLEGPCSVLEMMIALVIRCEETIMDDPALGDRTGQWFWDMIVNLGLGSMDDNRFDIGYVREVIDRFLARDYEPDGRGGPFYIKRCREDLRTVELWYQICWYMDSVLNI